MNSFPSVVSCERQANGSFWVSPNDTVSVSYPPGKACKTCGVILAQDKVFRHMAHTQAHENQHESQNDEPQLDLFVHSVNAAKR